MMAIVFRLLSLKWGASLSGAAWLWVALSWNCVIPVTGEKAFDESAIAFSRWINGLWSGAPLTALFNTYNHGVYCLRLLIDQGIRVLLQGLPHL